MTHHQSLIVREETGKNGGIVTHVGDSGKQFSERPQVDFEFVRLKSRMRIPGATSTKSV